MSIPSSLASSLRRIEDNQRTISNVYDDILNTSGVRTGTLLEETARLRAQLWDELGCSGEEGGTADGQDGEDDGEEEEGEDEEEVWCPPLSQSLMDRLERLRLPEVGILPPTRSKRPQSAFATRLHSRLSRSTPISCSICFESIGATAASTTTDNCIPPNNREGGGSASRSRSSIWTAIRLPCFHIFCEACILKWLARCGSCPTCRSEVSNPTSTTTSNVQLAPPASLVPPVVPRPFESVVFTGSQIDTRPTTSTRTIPPRPMSALSSCTRRDAPPRPSSAALRPVSRGQHGSLSQQQQRPLQMSVTSLEFSGIGIKRAPSPSSLQSPIATTRIPPSPSHKRPTTATSRLQAANLQRPANIAAPITTTQRPLSQSQQLRPTSAAFQRHVSLSTRPASASSSRYPNPTMRPLAVVGLHMSKSK